MNVKVTPLLSLLAMTLTLGCQTIAESTNPESASATFSEPGASVDKSHLSAVVTLEDAIHLERRAGIGIPKYRVERLLDLSRAEAIDLILMDLEDGARGQYELPKWVDQGSIVFLENRFKDCRISQSRRILSLEDEWIETILMTKSPAYERLVLLFSNHFVADFNTYRIAEAYAHHHKIIRDNAAGNMRTFLNAVLKDPAVIIYLNNNNNFISNVNENLAREYLELFTLGEGNYAEADIRNLAKVFAGESVNPISQEYEHLSVGSGSRGREVLGKKIVNPEDSVSLVLEMAAHSSHMAEVFFREYINAEKLDNQTVFSIAKAYFESDFEISALIRATLESPAFWAEENRYSLIKDPIDLVLGTARTIGMTNDMDLDFRDFRSAFVNIGYDLINPPNVAGYPGGMSWIDGGVLEKRIDMLNKMYVTQRQPVNLEEMNEAKARWLSKGRESRVQYLEQLNEVVQKAPSDQMIVEAAFLHYAERSFSQDQHPSFKISLLGVHFGGKRWEGISYQLGRDKKKGYDYLRIESDDCFPACIKNFSGGFSKKYGVKVVKYDPFNPTAGNRNVSQTLSGEERLLLKRLAQIVHFLPSTKIENVRQFSSGGPENHKHWMDWLDKRKNIAKFTAIETKSGSRVDPIIIPGGAFHRMNVCKARFDNALDQKWHRLERPIPESLTKGANRGWIANTIPNDFKLQTGSEIERVMLSEAFQLK